MIHDAHRHGVLTFKEVIQKSSNVGSIMIGMKLGKENVYNMQSSSGMAKRRALICRARYRAGSGSLRMVCNLDRRHTDRQEVA